MEATDAGKKSWSFISEDSFCAPAEVPIEVLESLARDSSEDGGDVDLAADMLRFQDQMQQPRMLGAAALEKKRSKSTPRGPRKASSPKRKMTVTFQDDHRESIPMVYRKSSAPSPPIQLLEEPVVRPRPRERSNTPPNVFNHVLYGSLRHGESVDPLSRDFLGLAMTAVASGFMVPFLSNCFHPLLTVYLNFNEQQSRATEQFLKLPGVISFFIGVVSDFYPLWSFHRKSYMIGGWVFAYFNLMALVIITMVDDHTDLLDESVRTLCGGIVYVLLMMGTSLGVTIASVSAVAFLVELSQREAIHDRGSKMMKYFVLRQFFTLASIVFTSLIMDHDETTKRTRSLVSLKMIVLLMAVITLIPIPAVLFRLSEEKREIKVDSVDRLSLAHQLWNIIQQQAVWRIIAFICAFMFLVYFEFDNAARALDHWSHVSPNADRLGEIPLHAVSFITMLVFRMFFLNYSWIRITAGGLVIFVVTRLAASLPVIFNGVRSPWFFLR
ncbi:hypothetical protein PINS_up005754 [Pythium insidiosum]|nr:hypothetical protein PINS_up005754 [Pythium insidiosum]